MLRCSVRRGALAAVLALGALVAPGSAGAQSQPTHPDLPGGFAITNARIVPVSGSPIASGTIVVEDGIIRAVGANVAVPAGAWTIDGTGLTVYPGLIDAFSTLGHPQPRGGGGGQGVGNGQAEHSWGPEDRPATFTWMSAADEVSAADDRIEEWSDAGFTSAVTTRSQGFFPGRAALINLNPRADRARAMVVAPLGVQRINLQSRISSGYPGSLLGSFAYIKQLYEDAEHYDRLWTAYERNPAGQTRPEYDRALEPLRGSSPVLFPASDRKEIERAIRTGREIGRPVIVYGAQSAWDAADVLRAASTPALVDIDWPAPPRNGDPEAEPDLGTLRAWEHAASTPARLHEAGVTFALYAGSLSDPEDALDRVRKAIRAGLPEDAALRALTIEPARIFGVGDRLGSIEPGKIANLVITDGNLFDEGTEIRRVVVDGRPREIVDTGAGTGGRTARGGDADADSADAPAATGPAVALATIDGPYRSDRVTLIRDATVMTVTNGTIEGGDVLIRDGRIAAVGQDVRAPGDAVVVDGRGMYVTPGIIDAHSHIAADAINEGTVNVSAMVGMRDVVNPDDHRIYRALAGGVTTVNLLHGSANPIGGRNATLKLRWGADAGEMIFEGAPEGIKFALGENTKRERNPLRYPVTRMGVQDVIREAFLDAQEYMREWEAWERRGRRGRNAVEPRRDLEMETLAEILRGERLVHAHTYRADETLHLLRLAEEMGFRIQTFQHILEGYKVADELAAHGAGASTFSDWWAYKVEAWDAIPHNAALMTDRGVLVSINSDDAEEMRHLNQEAAKTMKWGGLSEEQALRLVTINPAIQLGIEDQVGSIEVGKDADLVVFNAHPLTIDAVVQQTYVDGNRYFDIELDRARTAAIENEREALMQKHQPARGDDAAPSGRGEVAR